MAILCAVALLVFTVVGSTSALPHRDFYSYYYYYYSQYFNGDHSPPISLSEPFPFFGTNFTTLYVNKDGHISFDSPYRAYTPQRFNESVNRPLIAPYWADANTRCGGVYYGETEEREMVQREIKTHFREATRFTPHMVFIATWEYTSYYELHGPSCDKYNTFQCILATDGSLSFVIFLYADGRIQWTTGDRSNGTNGLGGTEAHIGVTAGDGQNFITHEYSFTPQVLNITSSSVPDTVNVSGMLIYRVDGLKVMVSPNQVYDRGSNATLICEYEELGNDSDVQWLQEEKVLSEESGRVEIANVNGSLSMLTLLNLTVDDGGEYTCQVNTSDGIQTAITSIFISPYFTLKPEETRGTNGTTVVITCEAEGYPDPVYQWNRVDGKRLSETVKGKDSGMLEFAPVQFGDQSTYTCNVTTGDITIVSNATLTVSPRDGVLIVPVGRPGENATVSLICISKGGPGNTFVWSTAPDGESEFTYEFGPDIEVSGEELIIMDMRFNAGRVYKCEVTNPAGRGSNTIILTDFRGTFDEFLPFYDLSGLPGLQELPRTQDSHSPPIFIPGGLVYGAEEVVQVYVNENGAFSFNTPWMFSHPNRYPTTYVPTRQGHVLSPFWSDVDIRRSGTVRFAPIERRSSTLGDRILNEASAYINARFIDESENRYQPTWVLVAQWDGVHPHPHGSDNHEGIDEEYLNRTNTFQGVIVTDTVRSFYIFSFTCGEIQWSGQGFETAIIGYNSNGNYFYNHPANGLPDIGRIVSCTRYMIPDRGTMTQQIFEQMGAPSGACPADTAIQMAKELCHNIANLDDASFTNINTLRDRNDESWTVLSKCPPTRVQLEISTEFNSFSSQAGDCYRSKNTFVPTAISGNPLIRPYEFVSVCCYERNGAIIRSGNNAGRITDISANFDIMRFKAACCGRFCSRYEDKRPLGPIAPEGGGTKGGGGWGDPHYTSFDNKRYDFVAAGEYTLFGVTTPRGSEVFHLQGRLGPRGWPATTTVALAFGVPGVYGYQFVHNDRAVLLQTVPTVQQVNNNVKNDHVQITHFHNSMTANIAVLNIRITATWHGRYINYQIFVPRFLCEISFGHLGNCDGNPNNDVSGPNDHRINHNQTLFTYGGNFGRKKREIDDELPLNYTYEEKNVLKKRQIEGPEFVCTSFDNCGDHNFVGVTLEDLTFTEEQRVMCNNDDTCLYDLAVTGEEEFATVTLEASEENTRVQDVISNVPPNITGDNVFRVNVGEENVYTFTVNDTNEFNVTIEGGAPVGSVLSDDGNGAYTFTWTPPATPAGGLSFIAMDNSGAATLHTPIVQVCACFNGGQCTEQGVPVTNELIRNLTCLCTEAYSGNTCSEDKNGCAEVECFEGVECFDVPAPGVGAVCGSCKPGFTGDGLKCIDLDECAQNSSLCSQICTNMFGGYECSCEPGYTLIGATCVDIDECNGVNDCQQDCTNTQGSFNCTCGPAFSLDMDGKACNPRTVCGANSCSHICAVVGGQDECFCPVGLELATGNTTTCQDIDECQRFSPCDQVCTNTEGSFECSCYAGFRLQNATLTCEDVDECRMAALEGSVICNETNTQCMNTNGSFECVCVGGYELVDEECQRIIIEVIEPPQIVIPMLGRENAITFAVETYQFNELTAGRLQEFRVATAMAITRYCVGNECVVITLDGARTLSSLNITVRPEHIAIPMRNITNGTDGRPILTFYAQVNSETVVSSNVLMMSVKAAEDFYRDAGFLPDLNECATDNGGCNQTCTNTDGSFQCSCGSGYTLAADNLGCDDVDECKFNNGGCNQTCTNTDGSFQCSCGTGYTLAADDLGCDDVDECQINDGGCSQTCNNTYGSFECSCIKGYQLAADNSSCNDLSKAVNTQTAAVISSVISIIAVTVILILLIIGLLLCFRKRHPHLKEKSHTAMPKETGGFSAVNIVYTNEYSLEEIRLPESVPSQIEESDEGNKGTVFNIYYVTEEDENDTKST